jgi:hypothetical protein
MSYTPKPQASPAGAPAAQRDAMGRACFYLHFVVMLYIAFGWAAPWHGALFFYLGFLPCVVVQWAMNKNSCILNNFESLLRSGRWRDPGNEEEGAWLVTLARSALGLKVSPAQMDVFIYCVLAVFWGLGLAHLLLKLS